MARTPKWLHPYFPLTVGVIAYFLLKLYVRSIGKVICKPDPCSFNLPIILDVLPYICFGVGALITGVLLYLRSKGR